MTERPDVEHADDTGHGSRAVWRGLNGATRRSEAAGPADAG